MRCCSNGNCTSVHQKTHQSPIYQLHCRASEGSLCCLCLESDSPDCCSPLWPGDGASLCTQCFCGGDTQIDYNTVMSYSRREDCGYVAFTGIILTEYCTCTHMHFPFFLSDVHYVCVCACDCVELWLQNTQVCCNNCQWQNKETESTWVFSY